MTKKITETMTTKTAKSMKKTAYVCIGSFYTFYFSLPPIECCLRWFATLTDKPMKDQIFFNKYKMSNESELHDFECIKVTENDVAVYGFMTKSHDFFIGVVDKKITDEQAFKKITGEDPKYMKMSYKFDINFEQHD